MPTLYTFLEDIRQKNWAYLLKLISTNGERLWTDKAFNAQVMKMVMENQFSEIWDRAFENAEKLTGDSYPFKSPVLSYKFTINFIKKLEELGKQIGL